MLGRAEKRLTPTGCRTPEMHETWSLDEDSGSYFEFLEHDTDTVGTIGYE